MEIQSYSRIIRSFLVCFVLSGLAYLASCSSDSSGTGSGGGGGGGAPGKIFDSRNLNNGDSFSHVFDTVAVIPYYCEYHGGPGGVGMSGVITVNSGGSPSLVRHVIINSTLPTFSIDLGDTVRWVNNSGIPHTVESDN